MPIFRGRTHLPTRACCDRTRGKGFKLKEGLSILARYWEEILHCEGAEALAQAAQKSCGCFITESIQGQTGWGFEQPGLLRRVLVHGREVELDNLKKTQNHILWFLSSVIVRIPVQSWNQTHSVICCTKNSDSEAKASRSLNYYAVAPVQFLLKNIRYENQTLRSLSLLH